MMQATADTTDEFPVADHPIYWFCLLEDAMDRGDLQAAAEAQRELARLGVRVAYGRQRPARQGGEQ
jgi:hypothetical protein